MLFMIFTKNTWKLCRQKRKKPTQNKKEMKRKIKTQKVFKYLKFQLKNSIKNFSVANVEDKTELGAFTAKVVERMLNQNTYDQLADDFKYFDDPADG